MIFRLGEGWKDPVHKDKLVESSELIPKAEAEPSKSEDTTVNQSSSSNPSNEAAEPSSSTNQTASSSSPSTSESAKMWEPKTRLSIAQRLKGNRFLKT